MINTNANILNPLQQFLKDKTPPHGAKQIPDQEDKGLFNPLDRGMEIDLPSKPEPGGSPRMGPMDRMTPTGDLGGGGAVSSTPNFGASFGGGATPG